MPKNTPRYYAEGEHIYRRDPGNDRAVLRSCDWDERGDPLGLPEYVEALNDSIEYPWIGGGPSVEEAGGRSILVRLPKGGDLVRATRSGDHWIGPLGEILEEYYHGTGWLPVGWRRMPPAHDATRKV